jgi:predicted DNA-binding transcriptional regulator AlpA
MAEHDFELTIKGELTDARLDALFEIGCDDATFSTRDDLTFAAFDREAPTLLDAVVSAIEAVESVEGFEVLHVDPDELLWASEIAQRTGRSRQSIDQLIKGQRGPGNFPAPANHATRNPLWRWPEVEEWFAEYEGRQPERERTTTFGAVNGALEARHSLRQADKTQRPQLRRVLQQLVRS